MTLDADRELRDKIAMLLTGGVHYFELEATVHEESEMTPSFGGRWSSDVMEEVDDLVKLFSEHTATQVKETLEQINTFRKGETASNDVIAEHVIEELWRLNQLTEEQKSE